MGKIVDYIRVLLINNDSVLMFTSAGWYFLTYASFVNSAEVDVCFCLET